MNARYLAMKNTRAGRVLFVVGTGASLVDNDLSLLRGLDTFAMNDAVYFDRDFCPTYWTTWDWVDSYGRYVSAALYKGSLVFVSRNAGRKIPDHPNLYRINYFSPIEAPGTSGPNCLNITLSIGAFLGYCEVFLVGCDGGNCASAEYPRRTDHGLQAFQERGHIVRYDVPITANGYQWVQETIASHSSFRDAETGEPVTMRIRSTGAYHGLKFIEHLPLADAVALAKSGVM